MVRKFHDIFCVVFTQQKCAICYNENMKTVKIMLAGAAAVAVEQVGAMPGASRRAEAEAQAKEFGHSLKREIGYLTVHSVLHLLGYDHLDEGEQKRKMREREEIIMRKMHL